MLTISPSGALAARLQVQLSLEHTDPSAFIIKCLWLPGSQSKLAVVASSFVKLFDLAADTVAPTHTLSLPEDVVWWLRVRRCTCARLCLTHVCMARSVSAT